jgi:hypothetical protein
VSAYAKISSAIAVSKTDSTSREEASVVYVLTGTARCAM